MSTFEPRLLPLTALGYRWWPRLRLAVVCGRADAQVNHRYDLWQARII